MYFYAELCLINHMFFGLLVIFQLFPDYYKSILSNSVVFRIINNYDNNIISKSSWKNDPEIVKEEEAFLAKPKISRTPP